MLQRLFEKQLPACVAEADEEDPAVSAMAAELQEHHCAVLQFSNSSREAGVCDFVHHEAMRLLYRESFLHRLILLLCLLCKVFQPTASDRQYFAPRAIPEPLCWVFRPFRLLRIYGPAFLLRLTGQLISPLCRS